MLLLFLSDFRSKLLVNHHNPFKHCTKNRPELVREETSKFGVSARESLFKSVKAIQRFVFRYIPRYASKIIKITTPFYGFLLAAHWRSRNVPCYVVDGIAYIDQSKAHT